MEGELTIQTLTTKTRITHNKISTINTKPSVYPPSHPSKPLNLSILSKGLCSPTTMASKACHISTMCLLFTLMISTTTTCHAARRLLDTPTVAAPPSLPTIPAMPKLTLPPLPGAATLPKLALPPMPAMPTLNNPTLPPLPAVMPMVPKVALPPLPAMPTIPTLTLPPMPSIPTIPTIPKIPTIPAIPFLSPPPSTTSP